MLEEESRNRGKSIHVGAAESGEKTKLQLEERRGRGKCNKVGERHRSQRPVVQHGCLYVWLPIDCRAVDRRLRGANAIEQFSCLQKFNKEV